MFLSMIFFKRKSKEILPKKPAPVQAAVREKILTAEGWKRRVLKKTEKAKKGK